MCIRDRDRGGRIVVQGTPEKVAASKKSYTGKYLREILDREKDRK